MEDHSSPLGEKKQRIISSFFRRDNFERRLYLLGEEDGRGYCWNPLF